MAAQKPNAVTTPSAHLKDRNPTLHQSLIRFVQEAIALAKAKQKAGMLLVGILESEWVQVEGQLDTFQKVEAERVHYSLTFHKLRNDLIALDSFQHATKAIKEDPVWGPHMDTLVGSIKGSTRIEPYGVLIGILATAAKNASSLDPAEPYFESSIAKLEEQFRSPEIEYVRVTPLRGLALTSKVTLDSGLSIEPIGSEQVIELLNYGVISPDQPGMLGTFVHNAPSAALIYRFALAKKMGESAHDEAQKKAIEALTERMAQIAADEMRAIDLVSLILETHIVPLGSATRSNGLASGSFDVQRSIYPDRWHVQKELLQAAQVTPLQTYWNFLTLVSKRSAALEIAVRRFSHAMSRNFKDDQLIDLMICAESLYFNNDSEQSELSHRLAYRAALLLGTSPAERRAIFGFMKRAYAQRSKVVHGKAHMTRPKDAAALDALIRQLSIYLRQTILMMLDAACTNGKKSAAIDWSDLMFGLPE